MKDREELANALYLLRAGSNPDTFMRTLRAYVIHESTDAQINELLDLVEKARPGALAAKLGPQSKTPVQAQKELLVAKSAEIETLRAETERLRDQLLTPNPALDGFQTRINTELRPRKKAGKPHSKRV